MAELRGKGAYAGDGMGLSSVHGVGWQVPLGLPSSIYLQPGIPVPVADNTRRSPIKVTDSDSMYPKHKRVHAALSPIRLPTVSLTNQRDNAGMHEPLPDLEPRLSESTAPWQWAAHGGHPRDAQL